MLRSGAGAGEAAAAMVHEGAAVGGLRKGRRGSIHGRPAAQLQGVQRHQGATCCCTDLAPLTHACGVW